MQYFVKFADVVVERSVRMCFNKIPERVAGEIGNRPTKNGQLLEIKGVATYRMNHPRHLLTLLREREMRLRFDG